MDRKEQEQVIKTISKYIDLAAVHFGKPSNSVPEVVKRDPMYNGNGIVYMVSLLDDKELVNNRFAQYMVLLNKGDEAGFHEHGERKEQELYCIVHGEGEYRERIGEDNITRTLHLKKGNITAIQGAGNYHSITNIGDDPLIIFVIATNEPK